MPGINYFFLSAGILLIISSSTAGQNKLPEELNLRLGTMAYINSEMSRADVDATLKIYIEEFRKRFLQRGIKKITFDFRTYENTAELEQDIIKNEINVFTISSPDFYKFKNRELYKPILTAATSHLSKFDNYILLTGSSAGNLSQIGTDEIHISTTTPNQARIMWTELILAEKNKSKKIHFIETHLTEANLILSVFFRKAKYAVVSKAVFELVSELNPQIKKELKILAESQELINTFLGYKTGEDVDIAMIDILISVAKDLKEDPVGKQVLNLFKIDRMEPLSPEEMKSTENLIYQHNSLFKKK